MLLGLAGLGLTAQAQVIATLGFEDGDQFYHHKDSAHLQTSTVTISISSRGMCGMRNCEGLILVRMPWRRTNFQYGYRGRNGSVV